MKTFKKPLKIPLYPIRLLLVVADNIQEELRKEARLFGDVEIHDSIAVAVKSSETGWFGLFFSRSNLTLGILVHETFHATHDIFHRLGDTFDPDNQEPEAYLQQYLFQTVLDTCKKAGIHFK
jgi:hypothetical protein